MSTPMPLGFAESANAPVHIRRTLQGGKDRRCKSRIAPNQLTPTLCGAEPSIRDFGRKDALHAEEHWRPVMWRTTGIPAFMREYFANLCPTCLQALKRAP